MFIVYLGPREKMLLRKQVGKEAFEEIITGKKVYEGRLYKGDWVNIQPNDVIIFYHQKREVVCRVKEIIIYDSFVEMYKSLKDSTILPYIHSDQDGETYYQGFFPRSKEVVVAIEIQSVYNS